jgi:pyruvate dehydrogenase E1 component beta subunit
MPETTTYLRAITRALREEMRRDARVLVIGEDVAEGGPFGATQGLAEEFGARRVRDTPISESAITGLAVGAALAGYRPVVEIMFIDFITLALDQLVNQAAKTHYMSGGQLRVPLVIRTQGGAGVRSGAQHSQSLEAWLTHVPGLKVVMPATATDAGGLLKAAIRDDNPVVVVENKALYAQREEERPDLAPIPLGQARIVRPGQDLTIVATSRLVGQALSAAEHLARAGIQAEVIDPRTLVPLDMPTLVDSLSKTHRLIVAHEAVTHMGFGSEIAARLQEAAFDQLDGPIVRVGAPFTPVPVSPPLEDAYLPQARQIVAAAEQIYGRSLQAPRS